MDSTHIWLLLIILLIWLSEKLILELIQMRRKKLSDSSHPFEEHEPSKENWKLIIKYSLIVALCINLLPVLWFLMYGSNIVLIVGLALILAVPALAVGKNVAFRRFFHAGAIGIIGSLLGVASLFFLFLFFPGGGQGLGILVGTLI